MEGLRIYFDFALNEVLLYNPEKGQIETKIPVYQPVKVEVKNE